MQPTDAQLTPLSQLLPSARPTRIYTLPTLQPYYRALGFLAAFVAYIALVGIGEFLHWLPSLPEVFIYALMLVLFVPISATWPKRTPEMTYQRLRSVHRDLRTMYEQLQSAHHQTVSNHAELADMRQRLMTVEEARHHDIVNLNRAIEEVGLSVMALGGKFDHVLAKHKEDVEDAYADGLAARPFESGTAAVVPLNGSRTRR